MFASMSQQPEQARTPRGIILKSIERIARHMRTHPKVLFVPVLGALVSVAAVAATCLWVPARYEEIPIQLIALAAVALPGWNPKSVVQVHLRSAFLWLMLIALSMVGASYLFDNHVGSDRAYNEMMSEGQILLVTVAENHVDIKESSNGYTTVRNVTETATAPLTRVFHEDG